MFIGYMQNNENKTWQICQHQSVQAFVKEQGVQLDCIRDHKLRIYKLLAQKVTKAEIARRFNVTRNTVFRFVKRNGLEEKEM